MTHMTGHYSPLPKGVTHGVTVPPGRGGGRSGGPSRQTRTGTQDGDLQSGTDNSEAMAELAAQEAMAVQGAQEAMAVQGAQEAMAELGALEAMAELGALEAMAGGPRGRGLVPLCPAHTAGTLLPPQKFPWGS